MKRRGVQLLLKAKALELRANAVSFTMIDEVHWCSQHTNYIRANRPSYYYCDALRSKGLDSEEVRNELESLNIL